MPGRTRAFRICIAASAGGHLVQARRLHEVYSEYDHFYFTFDSPVANGLRNTARVVTVPNLHRYRPWSWFRTAIATLMVAMRERPDLIICTGAGVTVMMCLFCKVLGTRLVFVESMAKIETPTMTARLLYPFADLFIVQWPGLLEYFPRAHCYGRLL